MDCKRFFSILFAAVVLTLAARAASEPQILQMRPDIDARKVTLYVRPVGGATVDSVHVGGTEIEDAAITKDPGKTSLVTWILFDNSASMPEAIREKASNLLLMLLGEKGRGEIHTFCTFSDHLQVKLRDNGSFTELKAQIDALEYAEQKTSLIHALNEALTQEATRTGTAFVRIIVISTGGDSVPSARDTRTLWKLLQANNIPVYTIGCPTDSNADILPWMYDLSTRTRARSWDIQKVGAADIANIMHWEEIPLRVSLTVPENTGGDIEVTFSDGTSASAANPIPDASAEAEPVPGADGVPARDIALCVLLIAALGIGGVVVFLTRKPRVRKRTVSGGENTSLTLYLRDTEHLDREFSAPLRGCVTLGRGADNVIVLDYDQSISRTHCEIYAQDNAPWIQDSDSSGGTYVNGERVINPVPLPNGAIVRLGHVSYEVEAR